jgi:hypothetical protein
LKTYQSHKFTIIVSFYFDTCQRAATILSESFKERQ